MDEKLPDRFVLLSSFAFGQKTPQDLSDFQKIFDRNLKHGKPLFPDFLFKISKHIIISDLIIFHRKIDLSGNLMHL